MLPPVSAKRLVEQTVREEWGRMFASLVKRLGGFQLAEDCLQDAVAKALEVWPDTGLPDAPAAWLIAVAKRRAVDRLRREKTAAGAQEGIAYLTSLEEESIVEHAREIADSRLEMIFTCCHPALEEKSRVALTLRALGGLSVDEIAAAFLDKPKAMAQRLTRAKAKIKLAGIPYQVPEGALIGERVSSVLSVIYLIFNEGYSASKRDAAHSVELAQEAIRLCRTLLKLMPDEAEVSGLLALMLLHESRRFARVDQAGMITSLEEQNRARWDKVMIAEGIALLTDVLPLGRVGPYQLQAAISAVHAQSLTFKSTDWEQIAALYTVLQTVQPGFVVQINHAVALSYAVSVEAGLERLEAVAKAADVTRYQPYHAALADMHIRLGKLKAARQALNTAIELSQSAADIAFLRAKGRKHGLLKADC